MYLGRNLSNEGYRAVKVRSGRSGDGAGQTCGRWLFDRPVSDILCCSGRQSNFEDRLLRELAMVPNILTIAGSDSGGGAGIQADLKTIMALGGYGMTVITALTAQNGLGVSGIFPVSPRFVVDQLDAVFEGFPVNACKTGMLFSADIIEAVAAKLGAVAFPLVVDPVSISQSGHRLLNPDAVAALKELLIPLATLVTPNRPEAEMLAGQAINSEKNILNAARKILQLGPEGVLIKGGHMAPDDQVCDVLCMAGQEPLALCQPRVDTANTHGTGCTLSAAIATGLGAGMGMVEAVRAAQEFLNFTLRASFAPGKGWGPLNHAAWRSR